MKNFPEVGSRVRITNLPKDYTNSRVPNMAERTGTVSSPNTDYVHVTLDGQTVEDLFFPSEIELVEPEKKERVLTKRPWHQRPEQSDETVKALEAMGFSVQVDFIGSEFDDQGTLVSETFRKGAAGGCLEKITLDYKSVRTYMCEHCGVLGLAADKRTHGGYHKRNGHKPKEHIVCWCGKSHG